MVTADRARLARRAVRCYLRQTYPERELIVVDDGKEDLSDVLSAVPSEQLKYIRLDRRPEHVLGYLRNVALEAADGAFIAQWDDDDWYHPERLRTQIEALKDGFDACSLQTVLMHLDTEAFTKSPYVGYLRDGIPGTIVHRRNPGVAYPPLRRGEDTAYLKAWRGSRYARIEQSEHLFIRCFHGANTWEIEHFLTRLRNRLPDLAAYGWYRFARGDLRLHPRFRLSAQAQEAFDLFLCDSQELGLFADPSR
jgi:glycosyltransferase involved in cell wall biosynthesis